jgi:hypothetical protein
LERVSGVQNTSSVSPHHLLILIAVLFYKRVSVLNRMTTDKFTHLRLSDRDLDFLVEITDPGVGDKSNLKRILREDEDFRNSFVSDEKVFKKLMADDEIFLKISPFFFFEILLRKAARELSRASYTLERTHRMRIPVFDTDDLVELLSEKLPNITSQPSDSVYLPDRNFFIGRNHHDQG